MTTSSSDFNDRLAELMESASPEPPLTGYEIRQLRRLLTKEARSAWIRKQVLMFTPWLLGILAFIGGLISWSITHVKFQP